MPGPQDHRLAAAVAALGVSRTRTFGTLGRHYGQRSTDQAILAELARDGELTNGQIARAIGMSTGGVTPAVDRLEAKGLVERRPNPDDRRSSVLALTDEGARMMGLGMQILREALDPLEVAMSEEDVRLVVRVLETAMAGYEAVSERLTSPDGEVVEWRPSAPDPAGRDAAAG